jgi:phytoene synthase
MTSAQLARFMARNSRSFRFASLAMPSAQRARVQRVYAWCRYTDDLVDGRVARDESVIVTAARLERWRTLSRTAFEYAGSGIPLLDTTMQELRDAGGSFACAEAIIDGVRSDLYFAPFATMCDLRAYAYNVASAVGLWLCALFGVRDPWMLSRAAALGHAMQLTNILRDVGEDLDSGRVYIPRTVLDAHGLSDEDLRAMRRGAMPIAEPYRELIESLMGAADEDYRLAGEAIPLLPRSFAWSVQIAAGVYRGIHDAIRANGYDNLSRRARTSGVTKLAIAARAFWVQGTAPERGVHMVTNSTMS